MTSLFLIIVQIWRFFTGVAFFGKLGFPFLINVYFLYNYSLKIENGRCTNHSQVFLRTLQHHVCVCLLSGRCFGLNRPRSLRAPQCRLYLYAASTLVWTLSKTMASVWVLVSDCMCRAVLMTVAFFMNLMVSCRHSDLLPLCLYI